VQIKILRGGEYLHGKEKEEEKKEEVKLVSNLEHYQLQLVPLTFKNVRGFCCMC